MASCLFQNCWSKNCVVYVSRIDSILLRINSILLRIDSIVIKIDSIRKKMTKSIVLRIDSIVIILLAFSAICTAMQSAKQAGLQTHLLHSSLRQSPVALKADRQNQRERDKVKNHENHQNDK